MAYQGPWQKGFPAQPEKEYQVYACMSLPTHHLEKRTRGVSGSISKVDLGLVWGVFEEGPAI
jgi:hypothetical protein